MSDTWFSDLFSINDQFKQFIVGNNVISTIVGVIIAYSAWDFIQSLVGDIILPGMYFLFFQRMFRNSEFVSSVFEPVNKMNIPKFTKQLFSFIIVIVVIFLSIQYIANRVIGMPMQQPTFSVTNKENANVKK
jgi:large-conductance mechanosensitive channel